MNNVDFCGPSHESQYLLVHSSTFQYELLDTTYIFGNNGQFCSQRFEFNQHFCFLVI